MIQDIPSADNDKKEIIVKTIAEILDENDQTSICSCGTEIFDGKLRDIPIEVKKQKIDSIRVKIINDSNNIPSKLTITMKTGDDTIYTTKNLTSIDISKKALAELTMIERQLRASYRDEHQETEEEPEKEL